MQNVYREIVQSVNIFHLLCVIIVIIIVCNFVRCSTPFTTLIVYKTIRLQTHKTSKTILLFIYFLQNKLS